MAQKKARLGRGLDSLISGGVSKRTEDAPTKSTPAKKAASKPARKSATAKNKAAGKEVPPVAQPVPEPAPVPGASGLMEIPVGKVDPNPHQPRRDFDEESLRELAESIRSEGLLQPIVVRPVDDRFQLIAGERRFRACQKLGMKRIPARIVKATEASSAVLSLIENLQREDLNPIEEALGYASLMRDFDLTQESVAERVGKGRASVANALRLLQLEREIQGYVAKGHLSVGHAKVLLGVEDSSHRLLLARQVIEKGISVRETERLVMRHRSGASNPSKQGRSIPASEAAAISDLEKRISSTLKTRVSLKHAPKKGKIIIEYYGNDDLQRIIETMGLE